MTTTLPLANVYATREPDIDTAIADIGTPGDTVGATWLGRHPQAATGPLCPPTTHYALGHDTPRSLGRLSLRIRTRSAAGVPLHLDLPDVHVLRHDAVPCSLASTPINVFAWSSTRPVTPSSSAPPATPIRCITPPRPPHASPSPPHPHPQRSTLPARSHQLGHASVASLLGAFPKDTFSASDVALHKDVAASCLPCQAHAHLPRRPRYALPPRPAAFNRINAIDVFQVAPGLHKVLDIHCLYTDFGLGRFMPSMRGEVTFAILYLTWLFIWGCPEKAVTDRGPENENAAFINALHAMGIHWRPIPTEAPWGIGRNERHHGPIRDVFTRILAETPSLAPDLALAMAYKARNDAPRAHGSCPTTAVSGEAPRLLIGHNLHADRSIARAPAPCRRRAPPWSDTRPPTACAAPSPTTAPPCRSSPSASPSGSTATVSSGSRASVAPSPAKPSTLITTARSFPPTRPAPSRASPASPLQLRPRPRRPPPAPPPARRPPSGPTRRPRRGPPPSPVRRHLSRLPARPCLPRPPPLGRGQAAGVGRLQRHRLQALHPRRGRAS
eukprot:TRINITY_DN14419_c0_g1_i1.p1 TRINITY_DN14419_c0_g1~~TRINITY_DN14419_c0_g1_i1.p1  ORF type:complete len:556 (-),score=22.82 TRINITY_DN14419_c0_g1_i1:171-1838(-)